MLIGKFNKPVKKIWLLEMPHNIYVEDVKAIAKSFGFKIVDKKFHNSFSDDELVENPPQVTTKKEQKSKQKKQQKKEAKESLKLESEKNG